VDGRTGRVQFSAKRIVIAVLTMVRFGMCVCCGAYILKIRFPQRTLVRRQCALGGSTGAEKNNGDERRENG